MVTATFKLRQRTLIAGILLAAALGAGPNVAAQTPVAGEGVGLVCVGMGGDGLTLVEWTAAEIADYAARIGSEPPRVHPETGECRDPAGLGVGAGWTPDWSWLCSQRADGRWAGPYWIVGIYERGTEVPPSPVTGDCPEPLAYPRAGWTEAERAAATAVHLTELEVAGDYDRLYAWMHPDAQALVPRAAMEGWYQEVFATRPPVSVAVDRVRIVEWTWGVTGTRYPAAAEVTLRVRYADGEEAEETTRLVRDGGVWRWFFGRDRAFIKEQIVRYG
jgi:hypothetical protein